jgi:hypothetical protein
VLFVEQGSPVPFRVSYEEVSHLNTQLSFELAQKSIRYRDFGDCHVLLNSQ